MIKKRSRFLLLYVLLSFCFYTLFGQGVEEVSNPVLSYNKHYLKPSALIIPGTLLLYGGLKPVINGIANIDNSVSAHVKQNYPDFHTTAADYLMWAPGAWLYVMDVVKIKTAHNFGEHLMIDAGSILITAGIGYGMRIISRNIKAYTSMNTKFPSGHTANAFRGAEILHQELKESNKLLSYSGYIVATTVGVLRIYNKDHLLSEVLAGAGLGILSSKLTYWIFDKVKSKRG